MSSNKIKAVLFDMDGVLIDAKEWHYEALNRALDLFGTRISRYDHLTSFDGLPTRVKLEMLTKTQGFPAGLHEFINEMKQLFTLQIVHQKCVPNFVHEYALSKLKDEGYKMAVCSNSVRKSVVQMMELANLAPYLDTMLSNEDVSKGKPDPEMYVAAMQALNLEPHECVIVEDNENGIKAARASGGHCLVVADVQETNYQNIKSFIHNIETTNNGGK